MAHDPATRLLTRPEVAARLGVSENWVKEHHDVLPFVVRLTRQTVRYSAVKLEKYIRTRQ